MKVLATASPGSASADPPSFAVADYTGAPGSGEALTLPLRGHPSPASRKGI
jgi:hypothetical protein